MTQHGSAWHQTLLDAMLSAEVVSCKIHRFKLYKTLSMLQIGITAKKLLLKIGKSLMGIRAKQTEKIVVC